MALLPDLLVSLIVECPPLCTVEARTIGRELKDGKNPKKKKIDKKIILAAKLLSLQR